MSQNFSLQELNTALKNNLRQDSTQGNPTLLLVYDVSYAIATCLAIEPVDTNTLFVFIGTLYDSELSTLSGMLTSRRDSISWVCL
jgi:hypothetical protein